MNRYNRRKFISTVSALAAAPLIIGQSNYMPANTQLVHHVFFWLKDPSSSTDRHQLVEGLKTLKKIKEVKQLLIGVPATTLKRDVVDNSFDVSELIYFDSTADQNTYQVDPIHKAFVEKYSHLWAKVIVYDMALV